MKTTTSTSKKPGLRLGGPLAAFLLGLPLAGGVLVPLHLGLITNKTVCRYLTHDVEQVTLVLFSFALGTLAVKLLRQLAERRVLRWPVLPAWDGKPVAVSDAGPLLAGVERVAGWLRDTLLVRRVTAVLDFLCQRGSAEDLDDQMRVLADNDAMAVDSSYGLTRLITWAIPILGFLGTVLGITQAISGVDPEQLETGMGQVTGGLSQAFDATALALGLTMVVMFCSYLVERLEHGVVGLVDAFVDTSLAHRFVRLSSDNEPFVAAVQQSARAMLAATGKLVKRQTHLWARALDQTNRRHAQAQAAQQEQLAAALEAALERTLQGHARLVSETEGRSLALAGSLVEQLMAVAAAVRESADGVTAQTAALGELQQQEKHLRQMQAALSDNLAALAETGAFEQAVHSLTAAVHLLTGKVSRVAPTAPPVDDLPPSLKLAARPGGQSGKAA